eukprot:4947583-Amphidinium_carterae.1
MPLKKGHCRLKVHTSTSHFTSMSSIWYLHNNPKVRWNWVMLRMSKAIPTFDLGLTPGIASPEPTHEPAIFSYPRQKTWRKQKAKTSCGLHS